LDNFCISKDGIAKEMDSWIFPGMHDKAPTVEDMKGLLVTGINRKLKEYFMERG
jgi:hypothetical protein